MQARGWREAERRPVGGGIKGPILLKVGPLQGFHFLEHVLRLHFIRLLAGGEIPRHRHRDEDAEDREHDDHLDEREPARPTIQALPNPGEHRCSLLSTDDRLYEAS